LLSDNFEHFFTEREEALIDLIETAMGKRVVRIRSQDEPVGEEREDEFVEFRVLICAGPSSGCPCPVTTPKALACLQ